MEELRARTTLFCGVLAFAIALGTLLRRRSPVHLLFVAFATDAAAWYITQSLAYLLNSEDYKKATAALTVALPQFAVHVFQGIVPPQPGVADRGAALKRTAFLLLLPMLGLALSPYRGHPVALALIYLYVFGLLLASLVVLWRRGQASTSRATRDRVRFLAGVGSAAVLFTMADFLSFLGVYLPPIGAVLGIVFLFLLSESLTRQRLADLYELVGRLLVSTALAFALAGIFYGFIMYLGRFGAMYLNAVLAAIVFLVLFEPLEGEVRKRIQQFVFRERYDLETSIVELKRRLAHTLEVDEMVESVLRGLERSRRVTSCAIYLLDLEGNGFDLVGDGGVSPPKRLELLTIRALVDAMSRGLALEGIETKPNVEPALVTAAEALGPLHHAVVLPIRGEDDVLLGFVCIADDRVKDAFTPEEIALMDTVATQMGVALTNSRMYAKLKERDRLAALGSMAAGLAHEVKNPLGAIKGAAQLLEESPMDSSAREFLGIILEETDRLNRVVGSFLDYARPNAGNPVPLDINAAVRRTVQILSSQFDGMSFALELEDNLPRARIDAEQFRQVLLNLVQNAIHAMNSSGTVTIGSRARPNPQRMGTSSGSVPGGMLGKIDVAEHVEVSVRDTGPGISPKVLKNLFVPFFTTKDQGTGLGLAISQRIIQNAAGSIDVQTHPGAGTKFIIVLPVAAETFLSTRPKSAPPISSNPAVAVARKADAESTK